MGWWRPKTRAVRAYGRRRGRAVNVVVGGGELSARLGDPPTGWACPVSDLLAEDGPFGPARAARRVDEVTGRAQARDRGGLPAQMNAIDDTPGNSGRDPNKESCGVPIWGAGGRVCVLGRHPGPDEILTRSSWNNVVCRRVQF